MNSVCAYGVVKDGRVVLDAPLPLADGTRVAVVEPASISDNSPVGPGKLFKTEDERREAAENAVLEAVKRRGNPSEIAELEQLLRELRGANDQARRPELA